MKQVDYLSSLGKNKIFKVMAWICLLIIVALIVVTVIACITNSKYFFAWFILTIISIFFMYVILWLGKVLADVAENKNLKKKISEKIENKNSEEIKE